MTRPHAAILVGLLAASATGCIGYRQYYDRAADQYAAVLRQTSPRISRQRVLFTVNVKHYVADELVETTAKEREALRVRARQTILDMRIFASDDVGTTLEDSDYHFIFDVRIDTTREPGALSGLIFPFYRSRQFIVRLQVLDEQGAPFSHYVVSAQTALYRHPLLLLLAPFYPPARAERQARGNVFEALTVKLIRDRKEFL